MKMYRTAGVVLALAGLLAMLTPARAESRIEKNLELRPGGQFTVESEAGSVSITGTSRQGAHIVITSDRDDLNKELEFTFTSGPGWASFTARRKHESFWAHSLSVQFAIELPTETRTKVHTGGGSITLSGLRGDAEVKTSGGPIEITGLVGILEAFTSGGPIRIREVTGNAEVSTSGGPINAEAVEGNLKAHTSGGPIQVDRVSGYVEAKTSGGAIRVTYTPGNYHGGDLVTSGGSIEVAIDRTANLNLDASTSGGTVVSDIPLREGSTVSRSKMEGELGSGGEPFRLHSSGGSIRIRAL